MKCEGKVARGKTKTEAKDAVLQRRGAENAEKDQTKTTSERKGAANPKVAPTTIVRLRGVCIGLRNCSRGDSSGFGNCLGVWDFWDWRRRCGDGVCGVFRLAIGLGGRA